MQRLIKAYLLLRGEASSNELALFLDRNFGYSHSLTTNGVRGVLTGSKPSWLNVEYVTEDYTGKWRLKE